MLHVIVLGLILLLYVFHLTYWKRRHLPPGPVPLPLTGNLHTVISKPPGYEAFMDWKARFGPVYTYWLGPLPVVMVCDYAILKETFIKDGDKYADRMHTEMLDIIRGGSYGVVDSSGDNWKEMRRFALHTLRDFGMGKNSMEQKVASEVTALHERIEAQKGRNIAMQWEFDFRVGSIINNVLFGHRYDETNEHEFRLVKTTLNEYMRIISSLSFGIALTQKWTRVFPMIRDTVQKVYSCKDELFAYYRDNIAKIKETIEYDAEESGTLVECFLKEQRKREQEPNFGYYSMIQLENILMDLWIAGMETTSNTLTWAIAYIINHPDVQAKIHQELDDKIKTDRDVTMSDKPQLNYLNATINEVQRIVNLLPMNLFHVTTDDVVIDGHKLPKKTTVIPQISCILFDEKIFPEPHVFKPERFLNADGSLQKIEEFVPFSVGKRQCLGEGLAKVELFLFLANIFQRYNVSAEKLPSLEKQIGFTMLAKPFTCNFEERRK